MATTTLPDTGIIETKPAETKITATKPATTKYVYFFGGGKADGNGKMKDVLGGKGAGLAEMTNAGLPVPPGFTIQTEACREYMRLNAVSKEVDRQMEEALAKLENLQGQKLGTGENPLLVSVRSGAKFSMPGMMDTILNLGLNDQSVEALARRTNNPRFAYDSYRRLIQMFGNVVLDIEKPVFDEIFDAKKKQKKTKFDTGLDAKALQEVIAEYKKAVKKHAHRDFPQDAHEQLVMARDAVFRSWQNDRAKTYRRLNNIDDMLGTAVNVQAMVFGNLGETSGTGVGFTRNPSTGAKEFYGEDYTYEQYVRAKNINFGVAYWQSAFSFAQLYHMPEEEAQSYIDYWWARFPKVKEWTNEIKDAVVTLGELQSPFGHKRRFYVIPSGQSERLHVIKEGINFLPQNIAGNITLEAMIQMCDNLDWDKAQVRINVHDNIVLNCKEDHADEIAHLTKQIMESAAKDGILWDFPFKADLSIGHTWGDLVEYDTGTVGNT